MPPRFHPSFRLFLAGIGALLAQGAVAVMIAVALYVAAQIAHRPLTDANAFANHNQLLLTVLVYPPTLLWLWFCRRIFDRQTFASLGLRARGAFNPLMSGALCGVFTLSLLFGVFVLCGFVHVNGFSPEWRQSGARSVLYLAAYALAFCCVGVTEEVVFRGYAFHNLSAWFGVRAAIWTQAILFGLVHLGNVVTKLDASGAPIGTLPSSQWPHAFWDARWGILNITLIGVFFAWSYLKTGTLWFAIGFHAAWDFFLGCVFSLPVSGIPTFRVLDVAIGADKNATGGSFGAEGSLFLVAILAAMLLLMRREKDNPQALNDLAALNPAILHNSSAAQQNESHEAAETPDEDDPTHISRFRTSMRPSSPQPALQLQRSEFDLSSTRSGFATANASSPQAEVAKVEAPSNATAPNATDYVATPFSPLIPAAATEAEENATLVTNAARDPLSTKTPTVSVAAEPEIGARTKPIVPIVEVPVTVTAPSRALEQTAEDSAEKTVTIEQSSPGAKSEIQQTPPDKPKKAAPKW